MTFLHGHLTFFIDRAENLPNTDKAFFNIDSTDVTDPFVTGEMGPVWLFKTKTIDNTLNPIWQETFSIPVCHESAYIKINVRDKEHIGSESVANVYFSCEDVKQGDIIQGWFDLQNNEEVCGSIKMSIQYFSRQGDTKGKDVPNVYFPVRRNNRLILYQDADTPPLPQVNKLI